MDLRIGQMLLNEKVISKEQLKQALLEQQKKGKLLGHYLMQNGAVSARVLEYYLNEQFFKKKKQIKNFFQLGPVFSIVSLFSGFGKLPLVMMTICVMISVFLTWSYPFLIKLIFDFFLKSGQFGLILLCCLLIGILLLLAQLFLFLGQYLFNLINTRFSQFLRTKLFEKLLIMHHTTFLSFKQGDLTARLTTNIDQILEKLEKLLIPLVKTLTSLLIVGLTLVFIDPLLTGLVIVLSFILLFASAAISNQANPYAANRPRLHAAIIASLKDKLAIFPVIKQYNLNENLLTGFKQQFKNYFNNDYYMVKYWNISFNIRVALEFLLMAVILYIGGRNVIRDQYSLGDLLMFILFVNLFSPHINEFLLLIIKMNSLKYYWLRCQALLNLNQDESKTDQNTADRLLQLSGRVRFKNISFAYAGINLFDNLNLSLEKGKHYAVTGKSGVGKSTLVQLLLQQIAPDKGHIFFDDYESQSISEYGLRKNMAYVAQAPFIFSDTIYENIRLGAASFSNSIGRPEVSALLDQLGLAEYLKSLPRGIDTRIGEGFLTLSGGEKQRLAIARALIKKPALLVLDEPTSALDHENRQMVVQTIKNIGTQCTLLLVTHQQELLQAVDYILEIKNRTVQLRAGQGKNERESFSNKNK